MTSEQPTPGSPEAGQVGCRCPVLDNAHGRGIFTDSEGNPVFWINGDCPIHGTPMEARGQ